MKRKFTLKHKLLISIFLACLIPFAFGAYYLNTMFEQWFYTFNQANNDEVLAQVDAFLQTNIDKQLSELVNQISEDTRVLGAESSIRSYMNFENNGREIKQENEASVESFFRNVVTNHHDVLFLFMGLEDGSYMEYPEFNPHENYDPRERPWYESTINQMGVVITDPYKSRVTQDLIVSFTKGITLENGTKGVIGISVSLEGLSQQLGKVHIDDGYIIVLNESNQIIISPKNSSWLLKTPKELDDDAIIKALDVKGYYPSEIDKIKKIIYTYHSDDSKYTIISITDASVYSKKVGYVSFLLIGIYLLTFVLVFYVVNFVANRFTQPIIAIAASLKQIDEKNINSSIDEAIVEYRGYNDEVGIIANAVHLLLENVIKSLNLLRNKNEEIIKSNDMLATSEEELMRQLDEIEEKNKYIEFMAFHDALTELPNRRFLYEVLNDSLQKKESGALVLMDIDNFKSINDTLGHVFGDKVIVHISKELIELSNIEVVVSRFGGDEFLLLIKSLEKEHILSILEKFKEKFKDTTLIEGHQIEIKFSIGISLYPSDSRDINQLIMNADLALYSVKAKNKNDIYFYKTTMGDAISEKARIETLIIEALNNNGFKLVYQPIIDANTGWVRSVEALLRFKDYPISPSKFIPIAENQGSIIRVGRHVMVMAVNQLGEWIKQGHIPKPVAINFSTKQLFDLGFIDALEEQLTLNNVDASLIEIEITESIFLENKETTIEFLTKLKMLGVSIAVDDFGTGYSSISYLTYLPVSKLKIDRSINEKFLKEDTILIIESIIALAHGLKLDVVAEGIETNEQLTLLKKTKCDTIQGFLFSKPVEAAMIIEVMTQKYFNS